jgi:hypothetical protein
MYPLSGQIAVPSAITTIAPTIKTCRMTSSLTCPTIIEKMPSDGGGGIRFLPYVACRASWSSTIMHFATPPSISNASCDADFVSKYFFWSLLIVEFERPSLARVSPSSKSHLRYAAIPTAPPYTLFKSCRSFGSFLLSKLQISPYSSAVKANVEGGRAWTDCWILVRMTACSRSCSPSILSDCER